MLLIRTGLHILYMYDEEDGSLPHPKGPIDASLTPFFSGTARDEKVAWALEGELGAMKRRRRVDLLLVFGLGKVSA